MRIMMIMMIRIKIRIIRKQLRIIIGVDIIITITMKTMRVARMMIKMMMTVPMIIIMRMTRIMENIIKFIEVHQKMKIKLWNKEEE